MKKMKSKLSVNLTTLRELSSREMARAHGGGGSHASCIYVTCTCPPTYNCGTNLTDQGCV
jgi:natural product precursor